MSNLLEQTVDQAAKVPSLISQFEAVGIGVSVILACFVLYFIWPKFAEGLAQLIRAIRGK